MLMFVVSMVAVALMMLGLSITLMRKGRNIQGDVGDNDQMKALGLECALKEGGLGGCATEQGASCRSDAGTCSTCGEPIDARRCGQ